MLQTSPDRVSFSHILKKIASPITGGGARAACRAPHATRHERRVLAHARSLARTHARAHVHTYTIFAPPPRSPRRRVAGACVGRLVRRAACARRRRRCCASATARGSFLNNDDHRNVFTSSTHLARYSQIVSPPRTPRDPRIVTRDLRHAEIRHQESSCIDIVNWL